MRALLYTESFDFEVREVVDPRAAEDEVLLRVARRPASAHPTSMA